MNYSFGGSVHIDANSEDEAFAEVHSNRAEYFQQSMEEGDFPDNSDIEVEYANKVDGE